MRFVALALSLRQTTAINSVETRTTSIATPLISPPSTTAVLTLSSSYACSGSQCPMGTALPADAASCQVSLPLDAVALP